MSEIYKELLVKRQRSVLGTIARVLMIILALFFLFLGLLGSMLGLLIGVVLGIAAYFVYLNTDVEYEYLYLDKELTIDKVMAKSKRKRVAAYNIEKLEILAPLKSHRLDSYNNNETRKLKVEDYSSKRKDKEAECFAMIIQGTTKVIIEADKDFVKAIYNNAPRKVFMD